MFKFLDSRTAKTLGADIAEEILRRIPAHIGNLSPKIEKRIQASAIFQIEKIISRKKTHLNFYQKAQLANSFKWKLKEAGLPKDYVESMTQWIIRKF